MKIYILTYFDTYEDKSDVYGYFSSYEKAKHYLDTFLKSHTVYDRADFCIDCEELDPDEYWMTT